MITGHGIHFDVIFEAQLYRKYLSFPQEWPSILMFYRNMDIKFMHVSYFMSLSSCTWYYRQYNTSSRESLIMIL